MKWCTKLDVAYRRGALLFLKVICQILRSHRTKNDHTKCQNQRSRPLRSNEIWPKSGRFQTITSLNPWMPIKCSKCYKFMGKRSITVVQHGHSNIFSILFADYRSACYVLCIMATNRTWTYLVFLKSFFKFMKLGPWNLIQLGLLLQYTPWGGGGGLPFNIFFILFADICISRQT